MKMYQNLFQLFFRKRFWRNKIWMTYLQIESKMQVLDFATDKRSLWEKNISCIQLSSKSLPNATLTVSTVIFTITIPQVNFLLKKL